MNLTPSAAQCPRCGRPGHLPNAFDCPGVAASPPPLPPTPTPITGGLQIGEYRVEEKIGAGGMGIVYRAVHHRSGRPAAIKVLSTVSARDPNSVRRFVQEIRTVNEMHHPNLVEIYSFGQLTDGRYYYVMELLQGCSLGALLRSRGRLSPQDAIPIFLDVLSALEAVHAKGIVHRDLKPDNVFLLAKDDEQRARGAKLLDFGLAKLVEGPKNPSAPLTAAGMAVGTPQYMAPEQCKAKPVDARTDLYSLGVMLYEALTGQLPCNGRNTLEIWEAQVRRIPPSPAAIAPHAVTPDLDAIVMTLLAKAPSERFSSANAVAMALASQIEGDAGISLDVASAISDGASAWEVARAIPSQINSLDVIPLGGIPSPTPAPVAAPVRSQAVQGLRDAMGDDWTIAEPANQTGNPAQVSALDIDLQVIQSEPAPAWAMEPAAWLEPTTSTRLSRGGTRAARKPEPSRAPWVALLVGAVVVGGAVAAFLFAR